MIASLTFLFSGVVAQAAPSPRAVAQDEPNAGAASDEYPEMEVAVGYSFLRVCPNCTFFNDFYMNGGGGAFVYNVKSWIGVKGEFVGYTTAGGFKKQLANLGVAGASGNLFTYTFGPQVKKQWGKFRPFGEFLVGAAHSNAYAKIFSAEKGALNTSGSQNAFAMQFGAGLDYVLNKRIQIRPAEIDCLYTRFGANSIPNYSGTQHSFKYVAGLNFTFGIKN